MFSALPSDFLFLWRQPSFAADARKIQQLNCFCSMGTETATGGGGFSQYLPGGMVLSGRTYHTVRGNLEDISNPLRWLLFDPDDRLRTMARLYGGTVLPGHVKEAARAVQRHNKFDMSYLKFDLFRLILLIVLFNQDCGSFSADRCFRVEECGGAL